MTHDVSPSDIARKAAKLNEQAIRLHREAEKTVHRVHQLEATQHEVEITLQHAKATARSLRSNK